LGKAWEAQLAMLVAEKKCWLDLWKNGYSRINPRKWQILCLWFNHY
jgi:hypothetical protein